MCRYLLLLQVSDFASSMPEDWRCVRRLRHNLCSSSMVVGGGAMGGVLRTIPFPHWGTAVQIGDPVQLDFLLVLDLDRSFVGGCRSFAINPPSSQLPDRSSS